MNWFFFGILTALFWGIGSILSRGSLKTIPYNLSLFIFGVSIFLFYFIAWIFLGTKFPKGNYLIPFISEFSATIGYILFYIALSKKEVSSIVPITSSYIVISIFIGKFILKNEITARQSVAIFLIISGIFILTFKEFRFEKGDYLPYAIFTTILWGIWGGLSDVAVRIVKPVNLNLFFSVISVCVWGIYLIFTREKIHFNFPKNTILLCVFSNLNQAYSNLAFFICSILISLYLVPIN